MNILIVEDDAIIAVNLALVLESAGHTVVGPVGNSDEAIELGEKQRPSLALVDINLGGEPEGVGVARALQRHGIPSIFVSAQHAQAWENRDAALGFIAKPYSAAGVCRSLETLEGMLHGQGVPANTGVLEVFPSESRPSA